jgi:hypothetical protein
MKINGYIILLEALEEPRISTVADDRGTVHKQ